MRTSSFLAFTIAIAATALIGTRASAQIAVDPAQSETPPAAPKAASTEGDDRLSAAEAELLALRERLASVEAQAARTEQAMAQDEQRRRASEAAKQGLVERLRQTLPIELYAFGDVRFEVEETQPGKLDPRFLVGTLEVDVEQTLAPQLVIAAGVAYDGIANEFGLGAFTVNGHLFGNDESHVVHSETIESSGVIVGKFDVPFGIDYLEYPSIDRRLRASPLAVQETHGAWNDVGAQAYLETRFFNVLAYGVNGFRYGLQDAAGEPLLDESGEPRLSDTAMALGGRAGFSPVTPLELGGSVAGFFNHDVKVDMVLAGADARLEAGGLTIKGEYIYQQQGRTTATPFDTQGLYGMAMYDFEPVYLAARYSQLLPFEDGRELSFGVGAEVIDNAEVRLVYVSDLRTGGSLVMIQLAGGTTFQPTGFRR